MTDFPYDRFDEWKLRSPEDQLNDHGHPEDCGCRVCDPDRARDEAWENQQEEDPWSR